MPSLALYVFGAETFVVPGAGIVIICSDLTRTRTRTRTWTAPPQTAAVMEYSSVIEPPMCAACFTADYRQGTLRTHAGPSMDRPAWIDAMD